MSRAREVLHPSPNLQRTFRNRDAELQSINQLKSFYVEPSNIRDLMKRADKRHIRAISEGDKKRAQNLTTKR